MKSRLPEAQKLLAERQVSYLINQLVLPAILVVDPHSHAVYPQDPTPRTSA